MILSLLLTLATPSPLLKEGVFNKEKICSPALNLELEAAKAASLHVDVGFWAGVVPGNLDDLDGLLDSGHNVFLLLRI